MGILKFLCSHVFGSWETIRSGRAAYMSRFCVKCSKIEKIDI